MGEWVVLLLVFILAAAVIILVAVVISERVRAGITLPGRAEFYIDVHKGWRVSTQPRGQVGPRFYLEMKLRRGPNWIFPLDGRPIVRIGRNPGNDLLLTDRSADGEQAVIYWEDGRYKIVNRSARVPTRVNNRPIIRQNLGDGNTIQMGQTKFIFRDRSKRS
jgi:hypothetical protein